MSTPNLGLSEMPQNSKQPSIPFNEVMQLVDALLQPNVVDRGLTTPPTTTSGDVGKRWIVGASATGAWAGQDDNIALCVGVGLWFFIEPKPGFRFYVLDEEIDYRFTATGWEALT